ncbi:hypothetical protein LTR17_023760 [Elasticomyces elasticus]|nr:hypothetical protein LTR17_023760 [Elasticomyces elasticus]
MDNLVFLNSQTSAVPSGRNARRHAQAERARLLHPAKAQVGQSLVLDLGLTAPGTRLRSRWKRKPDKTTPTTVLRVLSKSDLILASQPRADVRLLHAVWMKAMKHDLQDVLIIAAHHVRRTTAKLASLQPWRLADMLRCRQWAHLSAWQLQASESVADAFAFLAMRLQHVVFGGHTSIEALERNEWALRNLRLALRQPTQHPHHHLVLVSRLLALAELLELQSSTNWQLHTARTAALMRTGLGSRDTMASPSLRGYLPTLLEALLNHEDVIVTNAPWQALIRPLIVELIGDEALSDDVASHLTAVAALIAENNSLARQTPGQDLSAKCRQSLLARVIDARQPVKRVIMQLQLQDETHAEVLGLCLAALLGIDRAIRIPQPASANTDRSYEDDSIELSLQIMQDDLRRTDNFPIASLLATFQRHGNTRSIVASAT